MKLLFVHGTKVKEDSNGNYFTGGSFNEEIWKRYLSISTEFSLIARIDKVVYDSDYAKSKFNYLDKNKINFIKVPNLTSSLTSFVDYKKRKKINNIIKKAVVNSDYVIARLPSSYGNIAVKYARKFDIPYLVEVVGCSWDALWNYNFKGKLLAPISYFKQRKAVKHCKFVVYVTNNFLQKRYPTNGLSVNCSNVLLKDLDESILTRRIEKINKKKPNGKLIIGTAAAVDVKYKGQDSVIKALGKLRESGIGNFEYHLVGGGNQSYLTSIARKYGVMNQIKFLGEIPHKDVIKWLDSIDIYIQPSKTEGLPRALIEAMSRGILSLGTNAGGIPELLEDKYIFSKKQNSYKQINNILKSIDKEKLLEQANRNILKSKEYEHEIIEYRRRIFFGEFTGNN